MSYDALISRLEHVRQTGPGRWVARCPAHDDKGPSLSIRELEDGRVLLHCFAGCDVEAVLGAVGLTMEDLFPPRQIQHGGPERRPFPAADVLRAIAFEAIVVLVSGRAMLSGKWSEPEQFRLSLAVSRIQAGLEAGGIHG